MCAPVVTPPRSRGFATELALLSFDGEVREHRDLSVRERRDSSRLITSPTSLSATCDSSRSKPSRAFAPVPVLRVDKANNRGAGTWWAVPGRRWRRARG